MSRMENMPARASVYDERAVEGAHESVPVCGAREMAEPTSAPVTISMLIPTLNAETEIATLLDALLSQSRVPDEILVVDSSSDDGTQEIVRGYDNRSVGLLIIDRASFNHGLTRDMALRATTGDIVCFMTQDAVPANDAFIENLVSPILQDSKVAISSGRQLPKPDARRFEQLVRAFNYTAKSNTRCKSDIPTYGIKTFFATDVCAAYRRSTYLECGGFEATDMSEDMLMAAKAIRAGYKVAYAADAQVFHSHNLTPRQQYARNHAIGRFLERNTRLLEGTAEIGEGSRLAKQVSAQLLKEKNIPELCAFGIDCVARLLGNRAGRREEREAQAQAHAQAVPTSNTQVEILSEECEIA